MGGGKKLSSIVKDVGTAYSKGVTFGAYSTTGDGYAQTGKLDSATSVMGVGATSVPAAKGVMTPDMVAPVAMSAEEQKKRADAKTLAEYEAVYGKDGSKSGVQSTILGGAKADDSSVLKKKKLLGE